MNFLQWLRTRDTDLSALRRAGRAAIVMPAVFAIAERLTSSSTFVIFAAFSTLWMLLFVDFGGSMRERLGAQAGLVLAGMVLVCIGTLTSQVLWLAVPTTLVVAFAVLFVGVASSVLARATTALLVSFIVPVTLPGPVGSLPDRLLGWLLAGAASLVAIATLWPTPAREPLRVATAQACALLARRLRAEVDHIRDGFPTDRRAALSALVDEAAAGVGALRTSFFATPYRPTGLSAASRTLVRLIDQVVWLGSVLERMPVDRQPGPTDAVVCEVKLAAATLLERGAALLESESGGPHHLDPDLRRLQEAREAMEQAVMSGLPVHRARTTARGAPGNTVAEFVSALEPSFCAREMCFATTAIAANIDLTVAARRRTWWQHLLDRRPEGVASPLSSARERAGAHVERHSVWLHNSVRGAIALSLAVLVAELTGVQHSFWVVLGTLAVLRSNALNTGQNALRVLLGTIVGVIIGGVAILAIGVNTTVSWVLLPLAVAFTGLAPAVISFAAGQAGFTMTLLMLYNIIQPSGWKIGLVRVEDVAIGSAVSLVVGALFWPRGAGSALRQVLAEAISASVRYLGSAIEYGVTKGDALAPVSPIPRDASRRAAAAARRLDDAFRAFLADRGAKHVPLADATALITAVAVLRLTADAVLDLWKRDDNSQAGDLTATRGEILDASTLLIAWYEKTARALAGSGAVPDQVTHHKVAGGRLIDAVQRDLNGEDGHATAAAVKMIWTADHIDAARRLQVRILASARVVAGLESSPRSWLAGRTHEPDTHGR